MLKSFTYMFKDNKFIQKAFMFFIFTLIGLFCTNYANITAKVSPQPELLLITLIGMIMQIFPGGYAVSCIKALTEQKENYILPMFNLKSVFVIGFRNGIAALILCLVLIGIYGLIAGIFAIITMLPLPLTIILVILLTVLSFIPLLALLFYGLALNWIFANTQALTSFLQFQKAHALIKQDWRRYLKAFGLMLAISVIITIFCSVLHFLCINTVGIFIVIFIQVLLAS